MFSSSSVLTFRTFLCTYSLNARGLTSWLERECRSASFAIGLNQPSRSQCHTQHPSHTFPTSVLLLGHLVERASAGQRRSCRWRWSCGLCVAVEAKSSLTSFSTRFNGGIHGVKQEAAGEEAKQDFCRPEAIGNNIVHRWCLSNLLTACLIRYLRRTVGVFFAILPWRFRTKLIHPIAEHLRSFSPPFPTPLPPYLSPLSDVTAHTRSCQLADQPIPSASNLCSPPIQSHQRTFTASIHSLETIFSSPLPLFLQEAAGAYRVSFVLSKTGQPRPIYTVDQFHLKVTLGRYGSCGIIAYSTVIMAASSSSVNTSTSSTNKAGSTTTAPTSEQGNGGRSVLICVLRLDLRVHDNALFH